MRYSLLYLCVAAILSLCPNNFSWAQTENSVPPLKAIGYVTSYDSAAKRLVIETKDASKQPSETAAFVFSSTTEISLNGELVSDESLYIGDYVEIDYVSEQGENAARSVTIVVPDDDAEPIEPLPGDQR